MAGHFRYQYCLIAFCLMAFIGSVSAAEWRVGLYQNPPKIYIDEDGAAAGFFPAILDILAREQDINLEYVRCAWSRCLELLESGKLDVMPDVAISPERRARFHFGQEAVLNSWSYLYSSKGSIIEALDDLNGKRIALLRDSIQYRRVMQLAVESDWSVDIVPTPSHSASLQAVVQDEADVAIVNRFFGEAQEHHYDLFRSDIPFQVTPLYLAYSENVPTALIDQLDARLALLKSNPDSAYYTAYAQWLDPKHWPIPIWLYWLGLITLLVLLASIGGNALLRSKVARATEALQKAACEDSLTGTLSRYGFTTALQARFADHARHDGILVMLDIINIHEVNETHGYRAGDMLLRLVGARLVARLGESALVSRQGDDEFLLYVPDDETGGEQASIECVNSVFGQIFVVDNFSVDVQAHFGYTRVHGETDPVTLLSQVELALNESRKKPGTRWQAYTAELEHNAEEQIQLTRELRKACETDEFVLYYQPKVELGSGRVIGGEALIRWQHPKRGLLAPGQFINIAEQSQLIGPIGDWAASHACNNVREWRQQGLKLVPVSVNVSIVQFSLGQLASHIETLLHDTGIEPDQLTLEITESVFALESEPLYAQLKKIHDMGVRLSLDDFGTGYSSMAYLQRYPFDEIKIDRSFVENIHQNAFNRAIVATILSLGQAMDAEVIAEGVETAEEARMLQELGCTRAQGYYYSRPVDAEAFRQLLANGPNLPANTAVN